jgi:hypothetical protein
MKQPLEGGEGSCVVQQGGTSAYFSFRLHRRLAGSQRYPSLPDDAFAHVTTLARLCAGSLRATCVLHVARMAMMSCRAEGTFRHKQLAQFRTSTTL